MPPAAQVSTPVLPATDDGDGALLAPPLPAAQVSMPVLPATDDGDGALLAPQATGAPRGSSSAAATACMCHGAAPQP
eukprot:129550-Chlamydomonas_euryale.AAC.1